METPKRKTKVERLTEQVAQAKEALARIRAELDPKIEAERARVDALRKAREKAGKVKDKAYQEMCRETAEIRAAYWPPAEKQRLEAAILKFVTDRGLPGASVETLANTYMVNAVDAVPAVKATKDAFYAASRAEDQAQRECNVASNPLSKLSKMEWTISDALDRVAKLEKELEAVPGRNQRARERRAEERSEEQVWAETAAAKKLMPEFVFDPL